ncbi:MAG: hypothetical protein JXQ73_32215 [Phycisphaerae bacterium]|nr:hypothetical protein [Phycisphaerae bacterium]
MMRSRIVGFVAFGLVLGGVLPGRATAMTEEELRQLYLGVVELAVDVFEPIWVDDSKNIPNSGYYDFRTYDTWGPKWYANVVTVPGCGQIVYCYSVLLSETDKQTFGQTKLSRADLLDRCVKAIRWCCLTSAYVKNPYPFHPVVDPHQFYDGKQWRRQLGYRADELGWFTVACARLWDKLDAETKGLVEEVMIGGSQPEWLVRSWRGGGQGGNHDVVKQDLSSTIGAAFLFPQREDQKKYQEIIRGNGVNLVATVHDQAQKAKAEGKTIQQWSAEGLKLFQAQEKRPDCRAIWDLYQDYSSDHHGWCQVWYGCDLIFEGRMYVELLSHIHGKPVPEVYTYDGNGFDGVLAWVQNTCLPEGEPASVHGMEYDAYYGSGLLAYCYGAVIKKDPVAAALEARAAKLLTRHAHAVRLYDYHRNTYAKAATCYLLHKIHGPGAKPAGQPEAWDALAGNTHYRWQQCLVHRSSSKWASWSWGTISTGRWHRMSGFVVPARDGQPGEEPLIYTLQNSLFGTTSTDWKGKKPTGDAADSVYRHTCSDDGLSTAGVISEPGADRYQAFFAFEDGPCVVFTQVRLRQAGKLYFQGVPLFFYVRPKLTSSRTYWDAAGSQALEQEAARDSAWWCVADRLGVATVGGSNKVRIKRVTGENWARTNAYKDKADAIYTGTVDAVEVEAGKLGVDMVTAVYPETPHEQVAKASERLAEGALKLPEGWKGVVAPDAACAGRRYLAVANLDGEDEGATLGLRFAEGVAVVSCETVVRGDSGTASVRLKRLESLAEPLEVYVKTEGGGAVRAVRLTRSRYALRPEGDEKVTVKLNVPGAAGQSYEVAGSGETVRGQVPQNGEVSIAVSGAAVVELKGRSDADRTGPAVEIRELIHREDGQVRIEATAADQSGIGSVELYCDGKQVSRQVAGDYVWVHRPGNGAHTYHVVATDASPAKNKRTSFKRTIVVEKDQTRP